jgi:TetR/AcrR family transcriptional repressor of nem operon
MRAYISETHRDAVATGCPIAALANDMSRGTDETRESYTNHVRRVLEQISKALPTEDGASKRSEAALIFSACVGSITLARAASDPKLSKQILDGVLTKVLELLSTKRNRK